MLAGVLHSDGRIGKFALYAFLMILDSDGALQELAGIPASCQEHPRGLMAALGC